MLVEMNNSVKLLRDKGTFHFGRLKELQIIEFKCCFFHILVFLRFVPHTTVCHS